MEHIVRKVILGVLFLGILLICTSVGRPAVGILLIALTLGLGTAGYLISDRSARQSFANFLVRYAIVFLMLILFEVILIGFFPSIHNAAANLTAWFAGGSLSLLGVTHEVSGSSVYVHDPRLSFNVNIACLGGALFWTYMALVFAETRVNLKDRLFGIGFGIAMIAIFNLFRIVMSIYFEWLRGLQIHDYFYLVNVAYVLVVWAFWLRIARKGKGRIMGRLDCRRDYS